MKWAEMLDVQEDGMLWVKPMDLVEGNWGADG